MKIVLDTNIYISAFVFEGEIIRLFEELKITEEIFIADYILTEFKRKLSQKFFIEDSKIDFFIEKISENTSFVKPTTALPKVCRDESDNYILQLSEFVNADYLITGDKDLLVLKSFLQTKIISASDFRKLYQ